MAVEVGVDVEVLKCEIQKTYAAVSQEPETDFIFPTGRAWAEDLHYPEELARVPDAAVDTPLPLRSRAPGSSCAPLG